MPENEWVSVIDGDDGPRVLCDWCDRAWSEDGPPKHQHTCPVPVVLELEAKAVPPDDDLREALDQAAIALGVVTAQQNTGHDPSTYAIVEKAHARAAEALKGSKHRYPESPTGGVVRGLRRCANCGLRAYKWRRVTPEADAELRCVGCRHRHGYPEPDPPTPAPACRTCGLAMLMGWICAPCCAQEDGS
jgi:hypothetical protein